jgi:hypothetical protein
MRAVKEEPKASREHKRHIARYRRRIKPSSQKKRPAWSRGLLNIERVIELQFELLEEGARYGHPIEVTGTVMKGNMLPAPMGVSGKDLLRSGWHTAATEIAVKR